MLAMTVIIRASFDQPILSEKQDQSTLGFNQEG